MALMIVAHPQSTYTGYTRVGDIGIAFIVGYSGPIELSSAQQSFLIANGFNVGATPPTPIADPSPQYALDTEVPGLAATALQTPGNALYVAGRAAFLTDARKAWVPASRRARMSVLGGLTNGTDTAAMTRFRNVAPYAMTDVVAIYTGTYQSASREALLPNSITVRAAIEYDGVFYPLFFGGKRDVTIDPGALIRSDPAFVGIPKGATYYVRTLVTVAAGGKWPYGTYQGAAFQGDGVEQGTSVTDKTTSGTVTTSNNYAYGPQQILTRRAANADVSIAIVGDSVAFGSTDQLDWSTVLRAGNDGVPMQNLGYPGAQAHEFLPQWASGRLALAQFATHAIVQFGTNDIATGYSAAVVQADLVAAYTRLAAQGMKVYPCTLPPRTTSTDSWATAGNQTPAATEAVRVAVNTWIRSAPAPTAGFFDVADQVETGRNSGLWKPNYTIDGIHPNPAGTTAGATAINLASLTV